MTSTTYTAAGLAPAAAPARRPTGASRSTRRALRSRRTRSGRRTGLVTGAAAVAAVAGALLAAPHVPQSPALRDAALLAHLASLAVGFGAVLLLDLTGARWALRRLPLADVARLAALAHPAIWLGMAGLVLSGALLHPDPAAALTQVKLAAVVLVCANGGYATRLSHDLSRAALCGDRLPRPLLVRALVSGAVSQAAWWTAVVIGFLNTRS